MFVVNPSTVHLMQAKSNIKQLCEEKTRYTMFVTNFFQQQQIQLNSITYPSIRCK